jgi:hypothetical protein
LNRRTAQQTFRPASLVARQHRQRGTHIRAAATASTGKLIAETVIPAFIPRSDFLDQVSSWAAIEVSGEDGAKVFGLPMKVKKIIEDNELTGFTVAIVRDGATLTTISVKFDNQTIDKSEWVGRGADGFPIPEGNVTEVMGKHLVIRKDDDNPIDNQVRATIKTFCRSLVAAINKYYAFGSCFSDDST